MLKTNDTMERTANQHQKHINNYAGNPAVRVYAKVKSSTDLLIRRKDVHLPFVNPDPQTAALLNSLMRVQ